MHMPTFNLGPAASLEHVKASEMFLKDGSYTEALREAESAKDLDPASATAWKFVGDALEASGRSAEARGAYQNALHARELDLVSCRRSSTRRTNGMKLRSFPIQGEVQEEERGLKFWPHKVKLLPP
jgi:tetratricopeptide (TPR) repeat protein